MSENSENDDLLKRVQRLEDENRRLKLESQTYHTNLESLVRARTEQLQSTVRELERSYDMTLEALGEALDRCEPSSGGHSKRVTAFTVAIAKAMGLPPEQILTMARGAFLHDIGKLAIPDAILRKPNELTMEEIAIMQEHCLKGYQIVKKVPFLHDSAEIVWAHHERYDGKGYPRGLSGDQIPFGARVVAVANTLDAMTSDLTYRPARSLNVAREEIEKCSRTQFDPVIVKVFLEIPETAWQDLRAQVNANNAS